MSRITDICRHIIEGYAARHSGLDSEVLPHLIELGDHAETLIELEAALNEKAALALDMSMKWGREQQRNEVLRHKLQDIERAVDNLMITIRKETPR